MIGQTVSHYKILEKLGEGGMGVVYKAEDTKLKRIVALKFLHEQMTRDEATKERFVLEAQSASALQHNNICTIHEINESQDGRMFICMDYYDGETLREKIKRGPLPLEDAVDIAASVASGLAKAHEAGMMHRDIKPANIILTKDGSVKIVDFGLAKLADRTKVTKTGTTLGTVSYMSPEQAAGDEVDHRSDTWSLGVVLYEMLTGQLPFKGDHELAVAYNIVHEEPEPIDALRTGVPPDLQRVVSRAMDKKLDSRYQYIGDMLVDLTRETKSGAQHSRHDSRKTTKSNKSIFVLIAIAVIVGVAALIRLQTGGGPLIESTPATHKQLTFTGKVARSAISPDGKYIAYDYDDPKDGWKVMVQDLAGGRPLEVFSGFEFGLESDPLWSPDGSEILVFAVVARKAVTFIVPRLGGNVRRVRIRPSPCWSPDGADIASAATPDKRIFFTNVASGDTSSIALTGEFVWLWDIDWSPAGDRLAFRTADKSGKYTIWTIKTDGSQQQQIVSDSVQLFSPRWSADGGAIYYLKAQTQTKDLMKLRLSADNGEANDSPQLLQAGLQAGKNFTISQDARSLLYTRESSYSNLWLMTISGEGETRSVKKTALTTGTSFNSKPKISPDGKRLVFSVGASPKVDIYVMPLEGGEMQQLTFLESHSEGACWSPDGSQIAFGASGGGKRRVWRVDSRGGAPREFTNSELSGSFAIEWAPDANILYQRPGNRNFHFLNPETEEERELIADNRVGWIFRPCASLDGKRFAVHWNKMGERGIWIVSLDDSTQTLLRGGFSQPVRWSKNGNSVYVWYPLEKNPKIVMLPVSGGEPDTLVTLPFEKVDRISMTADGKRIVCAVPETQSDVWVMKNFDPAVK